jgi:3-methyladenine DNA glycosylase AlkC
MPEADFINIVLGSLDDPYDVRPLTQSGVESRMPWFSHLPELPGTEMDDGSEPITERHIAILESNRQHPDYDTEHWPPED